MYLITTPTTPYYLQETAREAIEFSAALRLPSTVSDSDRQKWVEAVVDMLVSLYTLYTHIYDDDCQRRSYLFLYLFLPYAYPI